MKTQNQFFTATDLSNLNRHAAALSRSLRNLGAPLLAAALALLPAVAHAQGAIEAWVQRHSGGSGIAVALDPSGNVVVAGSVSGLGHLTIKYSSAGVPLWTNLYGTGSYYGAALALAIDTSGNVYVTGYACSTGMHDSADYTTIKYSSGGIPLWTNLYNGPGNGSDEANAIALEASGDVIVTGLSGTDYATIKYSSAGVPLWTNRYPGSTYGANAIAVDGSGDVIVTGEGGRDYATIKYSSAGVPLWTNRYNGPGNGEDEAYAVAVDASGNVIVTGTANGGSSSLDYATVKYSGTGVPLWTNLYNGPGNYADVAYAMAVDAGGNVIVTGHSATTSAQWWDQAYTTIKYSSAGVPLWTRRYNGPATNQLGLHWEQAHAVAVDGSGNVIVTGYSTGISSSEDYLTLAYSSAGVPLWTNRYNGPGNGADAANAVAVDATGNVYITGVSSGIGGQECATIKYVPLAVAPPNIISQPLSRTNAVGTTASFTVLAGGGVPRSYQWRLEGTNLLDGGNLSGVATTNLLIANVQLTDAGAYTVVVTNAYGSTASSVARLTVVSRGRFSNLADSPAMGFSFIFRDATVGRPYRIQISPSLAEGSWTDWQSFTYNGPIGLMDVSATGTERRFYRAVTP